MNVQLVVIILVSLFSSSTFAAKNATSNKNCDKLLLTTDKCIQRAMLVGERDVRIPQTITELTEGHCKRVQKDIPCMRRYGTDCLAPLPRTLFSIGYKTAMKLYRKICFTHEGQQEWLRHIKCMQPQQLTLVHRWMDVITTYLEYIVQKVETNEVIPYICCSYFKTFEDAKLALHNFCDQVTGPETVDYALGLVKAMSSDMIDIGCGKYASVASCNQHLPEAMKKFSELSTPLEKVPKWDYSPVVPSVKILKRLDLSVN